MPRMIFHAPYRLNPDSVSASGIRPVRMREAFREAGYEVFELTGTSQERRSQFRKLKKEVLAGKDFDFFYSESATIPPMIADPSHFPHLFLDWSIYSWVKKRNIPRAVFYRDIYWRFDDYVKRVGKSMAMAIRPLYKAELALYKKYMNIVYMPSVEMGEEVPELPPSTIANLPPGGVIMDAPAAPSPVHLLYVGGIGPHYRLHELVKAVKAHPEVTLTLCVIAKYWDAVKDEYDWEGLANLNVVHRNGEGLRELYNEANVTVIAVDPSHYRTFAVPVKLYEYVGYGKPILATTGTLASKIVKTNGWGWVVDNTAEAIGQALEKLTESPELIKDANVRV